MFVEHRSHDFGMEEQRIPGDGVVTGWGTINGRVVYVFSKDFTVFGGSLPRPTRRRSSRCRTRPAARRSSACSTPAAPESRRASTGSPATPTSSCRTSSPGASSPDQRDHGPVRRRRRYSPAITDFIFMVKDTAYMYVTGPDVVKTVINEDVSHEELGGYASTR